MPLFDKDIALDMGTTRVMLYLRGKGVALREPTLVAVDKFSGKLLKVGEEAQKMLGRTPASIVPIQPIVGGVISDYDMTVAMLRELMKRVTSLSLFKPRVLVCVPGSITGVEERAVIDAVTEAGARKVYLVESAVATAYGAGLDVSKPDGHLIIDIGGGTAETAVVSLGGVAECESIKTAGDAYDEAIIRYIRRRHNVLVGEKTAEEVKMSIGCVIPAPTPALRRSRAVTWSPACPRLSRSAPPSWPRSCSSPRGRYSRACTSCWSARRPSWWPTSPRTASSCPEAAA